MFTGIISDLGKLKAKNESLFIFEADASFVKKLDNGTSVSINGACMTVTDLPDAKSFSVEVMPESQNRTMLGSLKTDDLVNLELPATPETFLSGHIVQGHIDGTGEILSIKHEGISVILTVAITKELQKYIVTKGSIAINGISLTVINVDDRACRVGIIPFTWEHTMFHQVTIGDDINIETDILAKYTEKLLNKKGE